MTDDGLLLNFAPVDIVTQSHLKYKGGSWKDRIALRKLAQHHHHRNNSSKAEIESNVVTRGLDGSTTEHISSSGRSDPRPTKRQRQDEDYVRTLPMANTPSDMMVRQNRPERQAIIKRREVISSLFSYNPKPSNAIEATRPPNGHSAQPSNAPLVNGIDTFTSLGLSPGLATHLLTRMELKKPTAIQKNSIPQLLRENTDAFIQSETGSGKTLAYLLPLVQRLTTLSDGKGSCDIHLRNESSALHRGSGMFAIVIAPTRELCKQITVVLERLLGYANWLVAGAVIGGEKKKSEKARLRKGLNILVATPGRLADHLDNTKVLDVSSVRWLVLDEGDRLMDLGFEDTIQEIVQKLDGHHKSSAIPGLPEKRTTILCSATMKMDVQKLGDMSLKNAVLIKSDTSETEKSDQVEQKAARHSNFSAPAQLKQSYVVVAAKLRLVTLVALLKRTFARRGSVMKAIVFFSCADSVDFHFEAFSRTLSDETDPETAFSDSRHPQPSIDLPTDDSSGQQQGLPIRPCALLSTSTPITLYKLHGSLPQSTRTSILKRFSSATNNNPSLLLATDVASRGLDLPNLDLVIEYDPAFGSDDHLHRIGRTARLGRDGRASIFLLPGKEEGYVEVLRSSYQADGEGGLGSVTRIPAEEILRKGFVPSSGTSVTPSGGTRVHHREWELAATTFQLDFERWVLSSGRYTGLARRAFQSHVRAYATHVAAERQWFDLRELHLGHLAKSFGLREMPSSLGVPVARKTGSRQRIEGTRRVADGEDETKSQASAHRNVKTTTTKENARKMTKMGIMRPNSDEFNIA